MKKIFLSTLIAALVFCGVQAKANEADNLYQRAYDSVSAAQFTGSQSNINIARERIDQLVGKVDWAVGEFSKQVDIVQNPILVRIVDSIDEAKKETKQYKINKAYKNLDKDLPAYWRSSYSQAIDLIQQELCKMALNEKERFIREKDETYRSRAVEILNDIKCSDNLEISKWAKDNINEINDIVHTEIKIGQPVKVQGEDGEWEFTVEGARVTDKRTEHSLQDPEKVIYFDYNYKNISCDSDLMVFEGMYYKLLDEHGNKLRTYSLKDFDRMPKLIPSGESCKATESFAVEKDIERVTVILYSKHKPIAKGVIDIK